MLRSDLIRPRLETREGRVWTRPLKPTYHYLTMASELTALFQRHVGDSRGELTAALRDYEGDSLDYPVIRGLAAVLEARCDFAFRSEPVQKLRSPLPVMMATRCVGSAAKASKACSSSPCAAR